MASIDKRRGKWRAQVRREGHQLCKTFLLKADAEAWARDIERDIDKEIDPSVRRVSKKDSFGSLIDIHIEDMEAVNRPLRRSKDAVLKRLKKELGDTPINQMTRERLIRYGRERAKEGAGPATVAIDISFIGTVLTHAAAVHGMQVNTEAVRLARVALNRLSLVGASKERDRRRPARRLRQEGDGVLKMPARAAPPRSSLRLARGSASRVLHGLRKRSDWALPAWSADPSLSDGRTPADAAMCAPARMSRETGTHGTP